MQPIYRYRTGFTLIELLTVIAIIAILAALLFPVFGRVREQTRQTQCFTNMHDIYRALKLYKEDNNHYPASLLGYVQYIDNANNTQFYTGGNVRPLLPAGLAYRPLFNGQKYLKDTSLFACPDEKIKDPTVVTTAVYPVVTTNGSGYSGTVDFTLLIQHNIFTSIQHNNNPAQNNDPPLTVTVGQPAYFYANDSYDIGPQLDANGQAVMNNGQPVMELHYSLEWASGPIHSPSPSDPNATVDPLNQMKYVTTAPEDGTVAYWCTNHAAFAGSDKVLVLLLNGSTKPVDAKLFENPKTGGPLCFNPPLQNGIKPGYCQ